MVARRFLFLGLVLLGASFIAGASGGERVRFMNLKDGGALLLEPDGGVFLGHDGGPVIVPAAHVISCGVDAGELVNAATRYRCKQSRDCVVRRLDLTHQGVPYCTVATVEAWHSRAVRSVVDTIAQECGLETRYPREACPVAVCQDGKCILAPGSSDSGF